MLRFYRTVFPAQYKCINTLDTTFLGHGAASAPSPISYIYPLLVSILLIPQGYLVRFLGPFVRAAHVSSTLPLYVPSTKEALAMYVRKISAFYP